MTKEEEILNSAYKSILNDRPSFSDEMIKHMKDDIEKIKKETNEWMRKHKKESPLPGGSSDKSLS